MITPTNPITQIVMFSPSGALIEEALLDRAMVQLATLGFSVREMPEARLRVQRFAGDEITRGRSLTKAVDSAGPAVLMATRGGYGLSRLLNSLPFSQLASQLNRHGHVLCGHSDITALQLALLNAGALPGTLLHGPMACYDFGPEAGANHDTVTHFLRAVHERRIDIQWNAESQGVWMQRDFTASGPVWGGNLTLLCCLLGTPWLPGLPGGILVLEDVNEPAYKIERMLLQLLHAGLLQTQSAIVLGRFSEPAPGPHDNGFNLKSAAEFLQAQLPGVPVLTEFPFGHCTPKACWFQGGMGLLTLTAGMPAQLTQTLPPGLQTP